MNKCKIKAIIQERSICLHIKGLVGECFFFFFFGQMYVAKAVFCTEKLVIDLICFTFFFFLQQGMQTLFQKF